MGSKFVLDSLHHIEAIGDWYGDRKAYTCDIDVLREIDDMATSEVEAELERFRQEWKTEVANQHVHTLSTPTSKPTSSSKPIPSFQLVSHESQRPEPVSAIECYEGEALAAVISEQEGRMNDALLFYRREEIAFKLDAEIDQVYHRLQLQEQRKPAKEEKDDLAFTFAKTLQLGPDYVPPKQSDTDAIHRHATSRYTDHLLESFKKHPFEYPNGQVVNDVDFLPSDTSRPLPLRKLPDEILLHCLLEMMLPSIPGGFPKVGLVEAFALSCRKARLITLQDSSLYKTACRLVYRPPFQLPPPPDEEDTDDAANTAECDNICTTRYQNDWRRFWLDHPRLRTDGCFISVVTYVRRGERENTSFAPSHIVVYYRFLRFLPNGRCLSLVTTLSPSEIARSLDPDLRMKGLQIGRWHLRGDQISCWDLEDQLSENGKYHIEMSYKLKSTSRGKMNKLTLNWLRTANRWTGEKVDVPLQHNKAFYFSCVRAYED